MTKGFRRTTEGYSDQTKDKKLILVKPLHRQTQNILSQPQLSHHFKLGEVKKKITTQHMRSLPGFFKAVDDPRRTQGRRHRLSTVLGIATAAVLCGMRSYESISDGAESLTKNPESIFVAVMTKGVIVCQASVLSEIFWSESIRMNLKLLSRHGTTPMPRMIIP